MIHFITKQKQFYTFCEHTQKKTLFKIMQCIETLCFKWTQPWTYWKWWYDAYECFIYLIFFCFFFRFFFYFFAFVFNVQFNALFHISHENIKVNGSTVLKAISMLLQWNIIGSNIRSQLDILTSVDGMHRLMV